MFKRKAHTFIFAITILTLSFMSMNSYARANKKTFDSKITQTILQNAKNLEPRILKLGIEAYNHARKLGMDKQGVLTIIDYTQPSYKRRLWVINMKNGNVPFNIHVAHGRASGGQYAKHFSNKPGSDATSIGVFEAGQTYRGEHGYSMRLIGLDKGYNNDAYNRAVVMHSAWYVSQSFLKKYGRLGRSWGCPAISKESSKPVINKIKDGSIILAYYPDKTWMNDSKFLQA